MTYPLWAYQLRNWLSLTFRPTVDFCGHKWAFKDNTLYFSPFTDVMNFFAFDAPVKRVIVKGSNLLVFAGTKLYQIPTFASAQDVYVTYLPPGVVV